MGCGESKVTRYWYHERSQAIVITASWFEPESGTMLALAPPRLFEIPLTVRRKLDELNRSAASTTASSSRESRRKIGLSATGADSSAARSKIDPRLSRLRLRSGAGAGVVGLPSFPQPCCRAVSWHSEHTSTKWRPSGEKRIARSPTSSVRSQIAHVTAAST